MTCHDGCGTGAFLSTPSARRATSGGNAVAQPPVEFLSTPSARRATQALRTSALR